MACFYQNHDISKRPPSPPVNGSNVCWALWACCVQWVALLLQFLAVLFQNTPSLARLIAFLGLQGKLLRYSDSASSSSSSSAAAASSCEKRVSFQSKHDPVPVRSDSLLPPRLLHDLDRLTVVLDLDETLVCAYESSSLPSFVSARCAQLGIRSFSLECIVADKFVAGKPKVNHVTVYERPGLREFLAKTSEFAEIIIFTAGLEAYARPVVDTIDPNSLISARLYRPATVSTKYREHVKDLSRLCRDLRRTVIVDNNPFSFLLQPLNGIPCVSFTGTVSNDNQLLQVLLPLLRHLATQDDVRPILSQKFNMPTWFQKQGITASDCPL